MGMPKNLFLVRHGQSEGNLKRKQYEENGDESFLLGDFANMHESQYPLTSIGVGQAEEAGIWLKENNFVSFDRMLVSNNVRAIQTASHLNIKNNTWMSPEFNLRERDYGLFSVLTPSAIEANYADQKRFSEEQPFLFRFPQGESIADVCTRVKIVFDTLSRECDGQDVIIVCHGEVIRASKIVLERFSLSMCNDYLTTREEWGRVPNCSITHYTRVNPDDSTKELSKAFGWVRMIRPAGGGVKEDKFTCIERKRYTNEELLDEAKKNCYIPK
jgi:broad specificity phosphatase PhoE